MPPTYSRTAVLAIAALAALAGALVLSAAFLLVRNSDDNAPIQIVLPTTTPSQEQPPSTGNPDASPGVAGQTIKVYVSGAVQNPGVYELRQGDRVFDAVTAAGGVDQGADPEAINLAALVRDEGYYFVPRLGETPRPGVAAAVAAANAPAGDAAKSHQGLVNLNTAGAGVLGSLPGIGTTRANAIIDHREHNGPFKSTVDVLNVPGIGEGTFEKIRDLVTVGPPG